MALLYSCCFWFSLRLGGILIGLFSIGTIVLTASCIAHTHAEQGESQLKEWYDSWNLISSKEYMENVIENPKKYTSLVIGMSSAYLISCILYIYGAYIYNNLMMFVYILFELLRLILISVMVATGLLLLKQNTMDIGLLIGASVVGGFFLLGMFYLWVCAASLPVLINEMEREEQAATIAKLQQLLQTNQRSPRDRYRSSGETFDRGVFVIRKLKGFDKAAVNGSRIPVAY